MSSRGECGPRRLLSAAEMARPGMSLHAVATSDGPGEPLRSPSMLDEPVTTADLLNAWREATRAAELAERLARLAAETATRAGVSADVAEEIAFMAEQTAESANTAAVRARVVATEARQVAVRDREATIDASASEASTRETERAAKDAYHHSEAEARARHSDAPEAN